MELWLLRRRWSVIVFTWKNCTSEPTKLCECFYDKFVHVHISRRPACKFAGVKFFLYILIYNWFNHWVRSWKDLLYIYRVVSTFCFLTSIRSSVLYLVAGVNCLCLLFRLRFVLPEIVVLIIDRLLLEMILWLWRKTIHFELLTHKLIWISFLR